MVSKVMQVNVLPAKSALDQIVQSMKSKSAGDKDISCDTRSDARKFR